MADERPTIAVLGGTGDLGSGLAYRWVSSGYPVILGSRSEERAEAAAAEIRSAIGGNISGKGNKAAATTADIVVLTVPYANPDPKSPVPPSTAIVGRSSAMKLSPHSGLKFVTGRRRAP